MLDELISFLSALRTSQTICYKRMHEGVSAPMCATRFSAGSDLRSNEDITLLPHKSALVHTGLCLKIPEHFFLDIRPRSGLALKHGVTVLNTPATIDSDYRGEIMVLLYNTGDAPFIIRRGDRIAQALLMRRYEVTWKPVKTLDETERGVHGFGSSGVL